MKRRVAFIVIAAVVTALCARPAGAAKKTQLLLGVHYVSAASLGSSQQKEFGDLITGIVADKGITLVSKQFKSNEEVVAAFLANKIDMAVVGPGDLPALWDKGNSFSLWGTYTVAKKKKCAFCLWQLKSRNAPTPADLAKSTLINEDISVLNYIMLRDFLFSKGIDKPVWKAFKAITRAPNQNSAFMALSMGKGDFFWNPDDWDSLLKVLNSGLVAKLKHPLCGESSFSRNGVIVNKKTVPKDTQETLNSVLKEHGGEKQDAYLKSKPELQGLRQMTKLGKIQFVLGETNAYDAEKSLYGKAKKNGWLGEAKFFIAHFLKTPAGGTVAVKTDFAYCRASCGASKAKEQCVDKCMGE